MYTLHSAVLPESVRAVFRHGIVEIHLPKVRTQQMFVTVPVVLHDDASALNELPSRLVGLPTPATEIVVVSAHEGSPRHKLGAAYAPNAGEDHAAKAQSVGESRVPGRATTTLPARQMDPDNAQSQAAVRQGHSEQKR